ncbi:kelch repeat-containing protein [Colletotrichum tofieldiae]|nr:kelch repeat-containing protein [Colletotrichum tofieldiae]
MNHVNTAVVDGKVYVFGGLDDGGPQQMTLNGVGDSWVYDPEMDSWTPLPSVPDVPRGMAAMGVHDGKVFLAGGLPPWWLTDLLPANARNLPAPRDHAGYAVVDSKMYVIGGYDQGTPGRRGTVFILDLQDLGKGWSTSTAQMPTPRGGFAFGVAHGAMYTFGGEGNMEVESGTFNDTEVYDFAANSWKKLEPMAVPRHSAPGFGVDGKVYIPGGGLLAGGAPINHSDVFFP